MPVGCNALNSFQLVAGCDLHKQIPPPPPAGPLPAPHVVVYCMGFAMPSTAKKSTTVKAGWGYALGRQHDLGIGIYHFAANALLPLVWAGAANKAEFGCASISIEINGGDKARMAVALIPVVGLNLQVDCNEPCAMPTSTCVASLNTVTGGFSLADCLAGFAAMAADVAITYISGKIASGIMSAAGSALTNVLSRSVLGNTIMLGAGVAASAFPTVATYVGGVATQLVGWAVGSPLGYSFDINHNLSSVGGSLNDSINDWISPAPPAPAPPPSPPPSGTPPSSSSSSPPAPPPTSPGTGSGSGRPR